jgi:hypothetical protein
VVITADPELDDNSSMIRYVPSAPPTALRASTSRRCDPSYPVVDAAVHDAAPAVIEVQTT